MQNQSAGTIVTDNVVTAPYKAPPCRVTKEQLAAAERARLYHVNKLAAYRMQPVQTQPTDLGGAR